MSCKIPVDRLSQRLGSLVNGDEVKIRIVAEESGGEAYSATYEIDLRPPGESVQVQEQYAGRVELNLANSYLEIDW